MRRIASLLLILPTLAACDDSAEHAKKAEQALGRAGKALSKAEKGVKSGYVNARDRVDSVDWVEAFNNTQAKVDQAADKLGIEAKPPAPVEGEDRWWERGREAVTCVQNRCTVAAWFVQAARRNPTRLTGDVAIFTAPDDSGWLLDSVKPASASAAMGFGKGDIVESVAGLPLVDSWARMKMINAFESRGEVEVVFRRDGERKTLTIVLESLPTPASG